MPSQNTQSQAQQQQAGVQGTHSASRSTASTSKLRMGNRATYQQQSSSGVQGGARSEPPRSKSSYPAPSTIFPSDSISVRGVETASSKQTRSNVDNVNFKRPQNGSTKASATKPPVASRNTPQVPQQTDVPYFGCEPYDYRADVPYFGCEPLIPRAIGKHLESPILLSIHSTKKQRASGSVSTCSINGDQQPVPSILLEIKCTWQRPRKHRAFHSEGDESAGVRYSAERDQQGGSCIDGWNFYGSVGSQLPRGIGIGVEPAAQMHFHYNHVDNRQLHISNNAPQNVVTNNNQRYNTDNSNHHNTDAPQANTYNTTATNVGNTHTNVSQKATTVRQSSGFSSIGRPPSESMAIRDKQYKTVKQVSFNEWTDRRKVTYKEVPNDRPC
ncbi:hypothetical protein LA080_010368 [Diaporthe eres]|nr:hypothetical protein LA080_010368 [Diaporthe eres]